DAPAFGVRRGLAHPSANRRVVWRHLARPTRLATQRHARRSGFDPRLADHSAWCRFVVDVVLRLANRAAIRVEARRGVPTSLALGGSDDGALRHRDLDLPATHADARTVSAMNLRAFSLLILSLAFAAGGTGEARADGGVMRLRAEDGTLIATVFAPAD